MELLPALNAFTVFLAIAAVGFVFLMVSLFFGEIFEHFDTGLDHDLEHGGPGFFSPRVMSVFVTTFGGTGAIATHRAANEGRYRAHDLDVRGLHLELRPAEGAWLRLGRQDVKLGSEVLYPEADWRYLKAARVGERLVGTVGWTHVERAYDGVAGGWDLGSHTLFGFLARPTTGVLTARDAIEDRVRGLDLGAPGTTMVPVRLPAG